MQSCFGGAGIEHDKRRRTIGLLCSSGLSTHMLTCGSPSLSGSWALCPSPLSAVPGRPVFSGERRRVQREALTELSQGEETLGAKRPAVGFPTLAHTSAAMVTLQAKHWRWFLSLGAPSAHSCLHPVFIGPPVKFSAPIFRAHVELQGLQIDPRACDHLLERIHRVEKCREDQPPDVTYVDYVRVTV
jgi:hypothetical protein